MLPTRSGSIIITMLWQPMPPPTSAPSGTLVDVLCGQPEQKYGERVTDSGISARGVGRRGRQRSASASSQPRAQPGGDGVGLERAGEREQRRLVGVALAHHHRMVGAAEQCVLHQPLEVLRLLLDDDHLGEPVGELAHLGDVERHRHAELEQPDAGGAERSRRSRKPEQAQCLHGLVVGVAGGDDAHPVVRAAHRHGVQPVRHGVLAGERQSHLVELALHVQRVRREERPDGRGTNMRPSTSIVGTTGAMRSGCTSTEPVPSATASTTLMLTHSPLARDIAMAWRPRSMASCTSPG